MVGSTAQATRQMAVVCLVVVHSTASLQPQCRQQLVVTKTYAIQTVTSHSLLLQTSQSLQTSLSHSTVTVARQRSSSLIRQCVSHQHKLSTGYKVLAQARTAKKVLSPRIPTARFTTHLDAQQHQMDVPSLCLQAT